MFTIIVCIFLYTCSLHVKLAACNNSFRLLTRRVDVKSQYVRNGSKYNLQLLLGYILELLISVGPGISRRPIHMQ